MPMPHTSHTRAPAAAGPRGPSPARRSASRSGSPPRARRRPVVDRSSDAMRCHPLPRSFPAPISAWNRAAARATEGIAADRAQSTCAQPGGGAVGSAPCGCVRCRCSVPAPPWRGARAAAATTCARLPDRRGRRARRAARGAGEGAPGRHAAVRLRARRHGGGELSDIGLGYLDAAAGWPRAAERRPRGERRSSSATWWARCTAARCATRAPHSELRAAARPGGRPRPTRVGGVQAGAPSRATGG